MDYTVELIVIKVCVITGRQTVVFEHFTQHQFIGVQGEGVSEHGHGDEVHVAVGALGLVRAGAVEVPFRDIYKNT